jgi:hypothetical protein
MGLHAVGAGDLHYLKGGVWVAVPARSPVDVQVFDTPGNHTWTRPDGAALVRVLCIAGGGGGGSGRRGAAASPRAGGAGAGGGGVSLATFAAGDLPATVAVAVGAGGAGAAARTTNDTNGTQGSSGGQSTFGAFCGAVGGGGGRGGTGTTTASSSFQGRGLYRGGWESGWHVTTPYAGDRSVGVFAPGGANGGPLTSDDVEVPGASGCSSVYTLPGEIGLPTPVGGRGGDPSLVGDAEAGWPGSYGAGGGGGGAASNAGGASGAGGRGGHGLCVVVSYSSANIQGFDASGVWTKPSGPFSRAEIYVVGAGAGGGAGAQAGTGGGGGAGGTGGVTAVLTLPFAELPDTVTVVVGSGGSGGAPVTGQDTAGLPGADGTGSRFGQLADAAGGRGGGGGLLTTSRGRTGSPGGGMHPSSSSGEGGAPTGNGTTAFETNNFAAPAGGGGGGGSGNRSGARGSWSGMNIVGVNYPANTAADARGSDGVLLLDGHGFFGVTSGSGGGSRAAGGDGVRGSGGGGGGGSPNGVSSGGGGRGGNGYVCVICV